MATNQTGIAIVIKAWLPTGKTLDEQLTALTLVKTAHETQDYAPLLAAAQIEAVLTDSKTRRVEEVVAVEPAPADTRTPEQIAHDNAVMGGDTGLADPADANTAEPALIDEPKPKLAKSRQTPALDAARDEREAAGA